MLTYLDSLCDAMVARDVVRLCALIDDHPLARLLPADAASEVRRFTAGKGVGTRRADGDAAVPRPDGAATQRSLRGRNCPRPSPPAAASGGDGEAPGTPPRQPDGTAALGVAHCRTQLERPAHRPGASLFVPSSRGGAG